jgi:hypothetical protein
MTLLHAVIAAVALFIPHHPPAACSTPPVMAAPPRVGHRFKVEIPRPFRGSKATLIASVHDTSERLPSVRTSPAVVFGLMSPTNAHRLSLHASGTIASHVLRLEFTGPRSGTTCVIAWSRSANAASTPPAHRPVKTTSPSQASSASSLGATFTAAPAQSSTSATNGSAGGGSSVFSAQSNGLLKWAPPPLTNPQTIVLQSGMDPDFVWLPPNRDAVIKVPQGGIHGTVEIDGGHNIVMIGGSITVPSNANQTDNNNDDTDQGIYIRQSTGTVHIEGVQITGDPDTQFDGIDINAPSATVQLENIRVTDVWGSDTTEHADIVQTWGGVRALRIDRLSGDGDYQGLTIDPDLGPVGSVDIENVDLTYEAIPPALAPITVGGGYMIWLTKSVDSCSAPSQTTFSNVYVYDESQRVRTSNTVWPPSIGSGLPCAGQLSGTVATWNNLPVTGHVTLTAPPGGPFVPAGVAGDSYHSPGYVPGS